MYGEVVETRRGIFPGALFYIYFWYLRYAFPGAEGLTAYFFCVPARFVTLE